MNQDVALGVTMTITQTDIPFFREAGRLGEYAVVYRVYRQQMGGGFGDQRKHPFAWGVLVYVDMRVARVYSARGLPREWSDLTRLEKWMREQGFWYWWMRNDLEPLLMATSNGDANVCEHRLNSESGGAPSNAPEDDDAEEEDFQSQMVRVAGGAENLRLPSQLFNLVPETED